MSPRKAERLLEKKLKKAEEEGKSIIHFPQEGQEEPAETIVERLEEKD